MFACGKLADSIDTDQTAVSRTVIKYFSYKFIMFKQVVFKPKVINSLAELGVLNVEKDAKKWQTVQTLIRLLLNMRKEL